MKHFLSTLIASISSLEHYHSVMFKPFWPVLRFYLLFLLLCTGVLTLHFWYNTLPKYKEGIELALNEVTQRYPDDLVISWDGEQLQLNQYPLVVPFPSSVPEQLLDRTENLLVVTDTQPPTSDHSSFFIASRTHLHPTSQGEVGEGVELVDLLTDETFDITAESLPQTIEKARGVIYEGLSIAGYFVPLGVFLMLLITSFYVLLLDTFIIFLFVKIQRLPISYKQLFQLGLALLVPAQIIDIVTKIAQLDVPISMLSLSFWVLFIVVFFTLKKKETT